MLDIRFLRENPEEVGKRLALRGTDYGDQIQAILKCDQERRAFETRLQELNGERKRISKEIGMIRSKGGDSTELEEQVKSFGGEIEQLNADTSALETRQLDLLLHLPNLPHAEMPIGEDASANPVIREWGEKPAYDFPLADHMEIGTRNQLFSSELAAKTSGSGFVVFTGWGARLERALIQFMLDLHTTEHEYLEVTPPFIVRRECMVGTSQLPKFEEDMYGLEEGAMFLAPTAEVPVTNLRREEILELQDLPQKYVAYTPCFRREAGSAGRDTRGMIRMHQFDKVELVQIVKPEDSYAQLEKLTADAEHVLQLLGLHYRVIELCTGDVGFGSAKTYDIEIWAPGHGEYLEVSSCSNFEDFQARRMNLRYKDPETKKNVFCHTLNGSGTALPRLFVALVETFQQPDGSIAIPLALQPYMRAEKIPMP